MPPSWLSLPTEMKFAVLDNLPYPDVASLASVDSATYQTAVPALFHTVRLHSYDAIRRFIDSVPKNYRRHIQHLDLCLLDSQRSDLLDQAQSVASLLACCSRLESLVLRMAGSMDKAILPVFAHLPHLKVLAISNCLQDEDGPVSERLVVHIAASLPNLHTLSLERISRSILHSPDLTNSYPFIHRVINDYDIPPHPLFSTQLNLPSLLLLPSLKKLSMKDIHLGDPQWDEIGPRVACQIEHLELGGCYDESEDRNASAVQRILKVAGQSVSELVLATPLPPTTPSTPSSSSLSLASPSFTHTLSPAYPFSLPLESEMTSSGSGSRLAPPSPPIPGSLRTHAARPTACNELFGNLKTLRLSPFFPIHALQETLANVASAPVHTLSLECFEMDVCEVAQALEDFLSVRVCRNALSSSSPSLPLSAEEEEEDKDIAPFFGHLRRLEVVVIAEHGEGCAGSEGSLFWQKQLQFQSYALKRWVGYCRDLGLVGVARRQREGQGEEEEEEEEKEWCLDEDEGCCGEGGVDEGAEVML
ncbi:hypothetical protein APHAL10511_008647 [Amanita phalloides]|nr:hypothetical protein APHAL10511_008647 [Amanita phalloides]